MFRFSKCQWGPEMCPGAFREKSCCPARVSKTTLQGGELCVDGKRAGGDQRSQETGSSGEAEAGRNLWIP